MPKKRFLNPLLKSNPVLQASLYFYYDLLLIIILNYSHRWCWFLNMHDQKNNSLKFSCKKFNNAKLRWKQPAENFEYLNYVCSIRKIRKHEQAFPKPCNHFNSTCWFIRRKKKNLWPHVGVIEFPYLVSGLILFPMSL